MERTKRTEKAIEAAGLVLAAIESAAPPAIDAVLAEVWSRSNEAFRDGFQKTDSARALEKKGPRTRPNSFYHETVESLEADHEKRIADLRAEGEAFYAEGRAIRAEGDPFEAEFVRRGGWLRYFLVVSSPDGHVHRERNCSTCNPRTLYSWIVELSDCDEIEMVKAYGVRACTTCFPDAPTSPFYVAAAPDPTRCEGQPDRDAPGYDPRRPWQRCSVCGKGARVTKHGRLPKHRRLTG